MTDKSEGEVSPQQTTNNEDSQNENINILDEVKETLRDEPSEYNLDLLFDHFEDLSGPYKKKVILYMEKAAGIKVGLIGAKAKEHLEALTAKQKDKGEKTDLIAEIGGNYFSTPQGLSFYYGKDSIPIEVESTQFEGLLSEIKYNADGRPANGEEILAVRRLARYYASKNVREVKLPPKHSAILKAKAYLEGISVSQKIVNSIITDLNSEVDSNYEVEEITL